MEFSEYSTLAGAISSLVVDTGATKGPVGNRTCTADRRAASSSGHGGEFHDTFSNTKLNVASGVTVKAAFGASMPLALEDVSGRDFLRRGARAVIHEDGSGEVPFLLSRSQMANLGMVIDVGVGTVAAQAVSGRVSTLQTTVRRGHLGLPKRLESELAHAGAPQAAGRSSAVCDTNSTDRVPKVPRRGLTHCCA